VLISAIIEEKLRQVLQVIDKTVSHQEASVRIMSELFPVAMAQAICTFLTREPISEVDYDRADLPII
jgi:hypothetical protein